VIGLGYSFGGFPVGHTVGSKLVHFFKLCCQSPAQSITLNILSNDEVDSPTSLPERGDEWAQRIWTRIGGLVKTPVAQFLTALDKESFMNMWNNYIVKK